MIHQSSCCFSCCCSSRSWHGLWLPQNKSLQCQKKFGDLSDKKHSVTNLAFSIFCYLSLLAHEWELGGLNCEPWAAWTRNLTNRYQWFFQNCFMTNCTENQKHVFAGILSAMHPFNLSPPSPTRPLLAGILSAFNVSLVQASCFLALPHQTQAYTLLTGAMIHAARVWNCRKVLPATVAIIDNHSIWNGQRATFVLPVWALQLSIFRKNKMPSMVRKLEIHHEKGSLEKTGALQLNQNTLLPTMNP